MANRIHDMFEPVKASEELKQSTVEFLQAERRKRTAHFLRPAVYRTIAAVCVMLMLLAGMIFLDMIKFPSVSGKTSFFLSSSLFFSSVTEKTSST